MNIALYRLVFKPGFLPGWLAILSLMASCLPQKQLPLELPNLNRPGKDQIADRFTLRRGYPDTLLLGGFIIVVEKYTKTARWDPTLRRFTGLTGYGRVKFSCQSHFFPWGGLWRDAVYRSLCHRGSWVECTTKDRDCPERYKLYKYLQSKTEDLTPQ